MTDLDILPGGISALAHDINHAGVVTGASGGFNSVAVKWNRDGAIQPLTDMPSTGRALNDFGDVTGLVFGSTTHGFLWHRGELTLLPRLAGIASTGYDINNRGLIAGASPANPNGLNQHAVLWTR